VVVMVDFTFSLLTGAPLPPPATTTLPATPAPHLESRMVWQETLRQVQSWRAPCARLHIYGRRSWTMWHTATRLPPQPDQPATRRRGIPMTVHPILTSSSSTFLTRVCYRDSLGRP
jgi:hypothetical protein